MGLSNLLQTKKRSRKGFSWQISSRKGIKTLNSVKPLDIVRGSFEGVKPDLNVV